MTPILYFLRSSETKIVKDMMQYAHPQLQENDIYSEFYGLSSKDLGLYALVDNKIAGAIWCRKMSPQQNASAFIDTETSILSMAVLPEFQNQGIGTAMMEQFLQEASASLDAMSIDSYEKKRYKNFLEKYGFSLIQGSTHVLYKKLERREIIRPTDGYDPQKWMD